MSRPGAGQAAERSACADREYAQQAVEQLQTSAGWQTWLKVRRHFRSYTLRNQLLIAMQKLVSHCLLERGDCSVSRIVHVTWRCSADRGSAQLSDDRLLSRLDRM